MFDDTVAGKRGFDRFLLDFCQEHLLCHVDRIILLIWRDHENVGSINPWAVDHEGTISSRNRLWGVTPVIHQARGEIAHHDDVLWLQKRSPNPHSIFIGFIRVYYSYYKMFLEVTVSNTFELLAVSSRVYTPKLHFLVGKMIDRPVENDGLSLFQLRHIIPVHLAHETLKSAVAIPNVHQRY